MNLTSPHPLGMAQSSIIDTITSNPRAFTIICILFITAIVVLVIYLPKTNTLPNGLSTDDSAQGSMILSISAPSASSKRAITENLPPMKAPACLSNFYALASRYTGYIGPIENGFFNADVSVQNAVNLGCRVFVLDIDYLDLDYKIGANSTELTYIPRIVVRDVQGKTMIQYNNKYKLNDPVGEISNVCDKINTYAFSSACQNAADPVIIVLYFLRKPPGANNSIKVLTYYSHVAKALGTFKNRLLSNEINNGVFHRQKQESKLLSSNIKNYSGKVLIFSNANTSGFQDTPISYEAYQDLDFLVNLRLTYTQTKLGITENDVTTSFGILQTAEDYMIIPTERQNGIVEDTKKQWTICLSSNPSLPVSPEMYKKITSQYGVHCIPAFLFDPDASKFLFADTLFKKHGFIPKPCPNPRDSDCLCYIPPPIVVAGEASPTMNSNQGRLRTPQGSAS